MCTHIKDFFAIPRPKFQNRSFSACWNFAFISSFFACSLLPIVSRVFCRVLYFSHQLFVILAMVNVEDYSDQQLKESLLEFGVNVPVTPTTRKVCENKLKKMMADGDSPSKQTSIPRTPSQQDIDFADNREETPENPSPHVSCFKNIFKNP